ncbi:MAG: hypothetical protein IKB01_05510 [Lachnospiraceae bacterium]|nr:hypothetical protein [Lachnospiraceae bacterium]
MKKSVFYWQVAGVLFTIALGVFLHFLFDMTNKNVIAALFAAVNESIWEHLKLLFYPAFLFAIIESKFLEEEYEQFWCVKLKGIILGILLIPVFYYTYTGILGVSAGWVNIAIFVVSAGIVFWVETRRFQKDGQCTLRSEAAIIVLCIIALVFAVLTFVTPKIPIFEDPVTGTYGFYELK